MSSPIQQSVMNTDREIWREREGDYYSNSLSVTKEGALCINVGGRVVCKSLADWLALAEFPSDAGLVLGKCDYDPEPHRRYHECPNWKPLKSEATNAKT